MTKKINTKFTKLIKYYSLINHKLIYEKYDQFGLYCPSEYLTEDENWDRTEKAHDNWLSSGGYDHEEESVIATASYKLKQSKFKSKFYGDFGTGAFDDK